jgi:hypothetical protein
MKPSNPSVFTLSALAGAASVAGTGVAEVAAGVALGFAELVICGELCAYIVVRLLNRFLT